MSDEFGSLLPTAVILGAAAVVALFLTLTRGWADESRRHIRGTVQIAIVAILLQTVHFTEELMTGLHERLPAVFDLAPMSLRFFVTFNVAWLIIWSVSVWGLAARIRVALFPLWFLAIGCIVNAVGHPLLTVLAAGYFPGLATSLIVGVPGVLLLRRLLLVTRSARAAEPRSSVAGAIES